jgi:hypothetical protein
MDTAVAQVLVVDTVKIGGIKECLFHRAKVQNFSAKSEISNVIYEISIRIIRRTFVL